MHPVKQEASVGGADRKGLGQNLQGTSHGWRKVRPHKVPFVRTRLRAPQAVQERQSEAEGTRQACHIAHRAVGVEGKRIQVQGGHCQPPTVQEKAQARETHVLKQRRMTKQLCGPANGG
jgi:hypothetical protein